ncbi:T-cell immunoreceptor with Ig and ITIM domains-like isoform X1 [Carcharodon carcharias]|uniref:T-cell immunoreceptor with Ig and ITIM domains-like isoform X1 n=1 Tax=Carcharodon carcharias TaxID=13397 RepID=UPI001B7F764C|nr:T-cell immunoreceptor with Ig and ITIM domains-like isoform X1 [Carcharodon carcharias]
MVFRLIAVMKMLNAFAIYMLFVSGVQPKLITKGNVTVAEDNSVTLQCGFSDEGVQLVLVEWNKSRNRTKLAVYRPNNTHHYNQRITMEVKNQHSTITIKEVLKSDKGWYSCIFHTFPNGKQEEKMYLDVKGVNMFGMKHRLRNLSTYISASVVGATVVILIIALVLWKMKRKLSTSELGRKPHKKMPFYENVDNILNTQCNQNSDTSMSVYENVDNITNTKMEIRHAQ